MNSLYSLALLSFLLTDTMIAQTSEKRADQEPPKTETIQVTGERAKQGSSKVLLYERQSSAEVKDVLSAE
ncbi:MAG: hypothetical protein EOP10_30865, partial [Proteobacteria bacterium]